MNEQFISELRLNGQFSVPIEEIIEGEELYRQLKAILKNYSPNITMTGQICETLETTNKEKKGDPDAQKHPNVA